MVQTLELGFVDWSGLSFIEDDEADTLEKLVKVTGASEECVVKGLEKLKAKGLIDITYNEGNCGKIEHVELSEKGLEFYCSYI